MSASVEIHPATLDDVDRVCAFLEQNMNRGIPAAQFRWLFEYPWCKNRPNSGYILEHAGHLVGYLGAFYAERTINGRTEKFCNPTNWCVLKEYRHASLSLLVRLLSLPDLNVNELTPIPEVEKLFRQLKFQVLDTYKLFSLPFVQALGLFRLPRPELIADQSELARVLPPLERRIFEDHQGTPCGYLLVRDGVRCCFVVWSRRVRRGIPFSEILYVGDREVLRRHFEAVKLKIMWMDRTLLVAIDERLIGRRLFGMLPYRRISLFRSKRLQREQIDNLYSELVFL